MEWIKWNGEQLPKGNYLVSTESKSVMEMTYTWNIHAQTRRGGAPRWEWKGRISPWKITHYMKMPEPPTE